MIPMAEYIERELLLKNIKRNIPYVYHMMSILISCIPSEDVAPVVHAHWVHDGRIIENGIDWYHCSKCGRGETPKCKKYHYCHNCGAKMDEKEDVHDS